MDVIEKRLHEHFASLDEDDTAAAAPTSADFAIPRDSVPETLDQPFAKVNSVVDNSPAATAGLKPGDLIRNFGYVNLENHDGLKKVAECVQGNEGASWARLYKTRKGKKPGADNTLAKHPCEDFAKQWRAQGARASVDVDAAP